MRPTLSLFAMRDCGHGERGLADCPRFARLDGDEDGRGAARGLSQQALDLDEYTLIRRASLSVPIETSPQERWLTLRLYPVSRSWDAGVSWSAPWTTAGGDYDPELYSEARVDLRSGTGAAVFDVTVLLKEVLEEGVSADGFLLTDVTGGARGVRSADVTGLRVAAGTLERFHADRDQSPAAGRRAVVAWHALPGLSARRPGARCSVTRGVGSRAANGPHRCRSDGEVGSPGGGSPRP
jgi:hypothetical protein